MNYKYSICHPEKPNIEYPNEIFDRHRVLEIIKNYRWLEILKSMENIEHNNIYFSPSLDFTNVSNDYSLCITATLENEKLEFSLWYNRPVKYRPLFGLLPEKTAMKVVDKWGFSLEKALDYYQIFLDKQYEKLESIITKK